MLITRLKSVKNADMSGCFLKKGVLKKPVFNIVLKTVFKTDCNNSFCQLLIPTNFLYKFWLLRDVFNQNTNIHILQIQLKHGTMYAYYTYWSGDKNGIFGQRKHRGF